MILGVGLGSIAVANRLHVLLDGAKISLTERNYPSGYTLQPRRCPSVFGVDDVNGRPRGKTVPTIKSTRPSWPSIWWS